MGTSADPYDLQRFLDAQDSVYEEVLSELRKGFKAGHWMWFIFPQLRGLGSSRLSVKYGVSSLDEARAYMKHPILSARLIECTELVTRVSGSSIDEIFGHIDSLKFRSCMTLFAQASPENGIFKDALTKYFSGDYDNETMKRL